MGVPYDECTCVCSPRGCTPLKFLLGDDCQPIDLTMRQHLRAWIISINPPLPILRQYILDFTRLLIFEFLCGKHTCCSIDHNGLVEGSLSSYIMYRPSLWDYEEKINHEKYCKNELPVPQLQTFAGTHNTEVFNAALETAMSHYDEMDRPDTMPLEDQPFAYLRWVIAKGYLAVDVEENCDYCWGPEESVSESEPEELDMKSEQPESEYESSESESGESECEELGSEERE